MTDRPILFSGAMIKALISGSKTQTRRALKPQPLEWQANIIDVTKPAFDEDEGAWGQWETIWEAPSHEMPMGQPEREVWHPLKGVRCAIGDRLWAREAWRTFVSLDGTRPRDLWSPGCGRGAGVFYEADESGMALTQEGEHYYSPRLEGRAAFGKLRPSMFMPRWASRLTLIVEDVKVERLQDISEADAIAEGVVDTGRRDGAPYEHFVVEGFPSAGMEHDPVAVYGNLWEIINGEGSWKANPFVAAYTFRVEQRNIDQVAP